MNTGQYLSKAARLVSWAEATQGELVDHARHGRLEQVERQLFFLLTLITAIHEALDAAAKAVPQWREDLDDLRNKDPLLLYLWKARNTEAHDAVVKWAPDLASVELVVRDPAKVQTIGKQFYQSLPIGKVLLNVYLYLYECHSESELFVRMSSGVPPPDQRLENAGVELLFAMTAFSLKPFTVRDKKAILKVDTPTTHLGESLEPGAHVATETAIGFYRAKLQDLTSLIAGKVQAS